MNRVGQKERATQNRVKGLFRNLGYSYLGNWEERDDNSNIEEGALRRWLKGQGKYDDALIEKALYELKKVAGDQTRSLYDINMAVYGLLRYGVQVKAEVSEQTQTVQLIDWQNPLNNDFGIAEEVTIKGKKTKRPDIVLYVNGIALGVLELKRSIVSVADENQMGNLQHQSRPHLAQP
jgi:type I restriction enzyme R subunit